MTNEEKILEILSVMQKDISGLKEGQQQTNQRLGNLEKDVSSIKEGQTRLENRQDEQHDILKAILHNQEFTSAKLEAIEMTTAKASALVTLDSKFEVLNKRLFQQEAEIQTLKMVK